MSTMYIYIYIYIYIYTDICTQSLFSYFSLILFTSPMKLNMIDISNLREKNTIINRISQPSRLLNLRVHHASHPQLSLSLFRSFQC